MNTKYFVIAWTLFGVCSSSQAQESRIHMWWNLYHNGWTGSLDSSWATTSLREGDSVPIETDRQYFAFSSGGLVALEYRPSGLWWYGSPEYSSEEELLNAWPTHPYHFFAFDGSDYENAGTANAVLGNGFSDQTPSISNPDDLVSITPGEPLELFVPAWSSPFETSNSTWLDILDWETRTSVWSSGPGSDSGMSQTFDTTALEPNHEYRLQVIFSARFISTTESDLLGLTDVLSGFDNRTVYRFTTASISPCPADLTGDGELDFFDVSAFIVFFQIGNEAADFTGDGSFDFFDVSAFLHAFTDGCP